MMMDQEHDIAHAIYNDDETAAASLLWTLERR